VAAARKHRRSIEGYDALVMISPRNDSPRCRFSFHLDGTCPMFMHNKRLMYTVRVGAPDPKLANLILEQFGGADGELAAAMRYFTQGLGEIDPGRKDLLLDIATEELSHLEVVGSIVTMLNRGVKAQMAEGIEAAELLANITGGTDSHTTALLYGGGVALTNSAGVPWNACYVDSRTEPTADFRSNIAAEARAKIIYERLINLCDDPDVKDALGFLMTREIAHQKSFEKALYAMEVNFPPGKLPGQPEFTNTYFNMSQGEGDMRGSWNEGEQWNFVDDREKQAAVDGGDGSASVKLSQKDMALEKKVAVRTMSNPASDPMTGAELGEGKAV
jgi:Mn-containing catalase